MSSVKKNDGNSTNNNILTADIIQLYVDIALIEKRNEKRKRIKELFDEIEAIEKQSSESYTVRKRLKIAKYLRGISKYSDTGLSDVFEDNEIINKIEILKKKSRSELDKTFESLKKQLEDMNSSVENEKDSNIDIREVLFDDFLLRKYPVHIKKAIEDAFTHMTGSQTSDRFSKMVGVAKILIYMPWYVTPIKKISIADSELLLNNLFYGMKEAKHKIIKHINLENRLIDQGKKTILLVGPPGTGKTEFAKAISLVLGREYSKISMGGITSGFNLVGADRGYASATESAIAKCLLETNMLNSVIILDEIDKLMNVNAGNGGNPTSALVEILDPNNNEMEDQFLRTKIDISKILFIATANNLEKIYKPLLDRMEVIHLDGYSDDEKFHIANDYVVKNMYEKYNIDESILSISDDVIKELVRNYCYEEGVRELINALDDIFADAIYRIEYGESEKIVITKNNYLEFLLVEKNNENSLNSLASMKEEMRNHSYTPEIKNKIAKYMNEYSEYIGQEKLIKYKLLQMLIAMPWNQDYVEIDMEKAETLLDKAVCGLDTIKDRIHHHLALQKISKNTTGKAVLLVGEPGTGKTTVAKAIGQAIGRKVEKISLAGENNPYVFSGIPSNMLNAKPGRITEIFCKHRTTNVVVVLDEIDKVANNNSEIISNLIEILDTDNSSFYDCFMEENIDLTNVIFVATANTIGSLPTPLLDRMEVIYVPAYTLFEKFEITKKYIIPQAAESYCLEENKIVFTEDAIRRIILSYDTNGGVRDIRKKIIEIMGRASSEMLRNKEDSIIIDNSMLDNLLDDEKEIVRYPKSIGLTLGVAVHAMGGCLLPIETCCVGGKGELCITGNLHKVMYESCVVAHTYIKANYKQLKIPKEMIFKKDIHIHFPTAVEKEGPSAGIAIVISMISALKQKPLKGNYAFTGEISMIGNIMPVGGVSTKVIIAHNNEMEAIFIPKDNKKDIDGIEKFGEVLSINCVAHINDVYNFVF